MSRLDLRDTPTSAAALKACCHPKISTLHHTLIVADLSGSARKAAATTQHLAIRSRYIISVSSQLRRTRSTRGGICCKKGHVLRSVSEVSVTELRKRLASSRSFAAADVPVSPLTTFIVQSLVLWLA
ncbi:uncharacterized protein MYCFIDRAFT_194294 [Pseudocercospora fijiensis CIRAD86]|uniref:Uncharacterized protein n=1 Tax=Pseudocercospora fijiensis (strain CIRAD86) TaxID=383855 RepID=M3A4V4_PSEFD|nr:uncharacterized protein MYCFIDRAFT_194294 [Pseudocercospora fijiensis CIRAD86]EME86154.1 hypothetical protein MYCFIDRAFT_194294 [Pseudocercospora fijiensis CIRAD86]